MNALVSIIIPVFNAQDFLDEMLQSVIDQDYKNWECIVVDDHSQDDSFLILQRYEAKDTRIKAYKRPDNVSKGANACRNYGFKISKGDYINWFDADDKMTNNFISTKLSAASHYQLIISSGYFANENLGDLKKMPVFNTPNLYESYFKWEFKIITASILFKRSFLLDKELFDIKLSKSQEFDFFTRIFCEIDPAIVCILETPLFYYRGHKRSKTSLNQKYIPSFKKSEAIMLSRNLKRSLSIKNNFVAQKCYRLLLNLLNKAIIVNDKENIKLILEVLDENLKGFKNTLTLKIIISTTYIVQRFKIKNTLWSRILKKIAIV